MTPLRRRAILALLAVVLLIGGGWLWVRDSSFVSIKKVTIVGVHGPESSHIRNALEAAAEGMTTLDVHGGTLRSAVQPFPTVAGIEIKAHPPHAIEIDVHMNVAVVVADDNGHEVPVAADGRLLPGAPKAGLPTINAGGLTVGRALTHRAARDEVAVAAAAPEALLTQVVNLWDGPRGVTLQLRDGPLVYFGDAQRLNAKWAAVAAVLADPTSAGAAYLDVTIPERSAAGGLESTTEASPPTTTTP